MNKLKKLLLISSALFLSTANNTFATPATGTISATGTVTGTCSVTATAMTFGTLNTAGDITRTSTVSPTCTNGTVWTVTNSADVNKLYFNNTVSATAANYIEFPIVLTGGSVAFTLSNAAAGLLTGTGTGSAQVASPTLTGTAGSSTDKTAGIFTGSVTLNISY
jgi:hypothetical protein